jgi:beta-glucosidase/6-phospho-beta-glucosidase/beta-galactosidase
MFIDAPGALFFAREAGSNYIGSTQGKIRPDARIYWAKSHLTTIRSAAG